MSDPKSYWIDLNDSKPQTIRVRGASVTFTVGGAPPAAKSPAGQPQLLVEMWESKDKGWEHLSREERDAMLNQIAGGVGKLIEQGLEPLGFFLNDPSKGEHREHWRFVAVWRLPSEELLNKMLPQVNQVKGWFDVMDEKRVWGRILDPIAEGKPALVDWPHEPPPGSERRSSRGGSGGSAKGDDRE
jgi:hypothetical protein